MHIRRRAFGPLALVVLLAACSQAGSPELLYTAVPESTWPQIDGVSVLKSQGQDGQQCCESRVGSRSLIVRVQNSGSDAPLPWLGAALADAGWSPTGCAGPEPRSVELCARTPGFFAVLTAPRGAAKDRRGIVLVRVERSQV